MLGFLISASVQNGIRIRKSESCAMLVEITVWWDLCSHIPIATRNLRDSL